MLASRLSRRVVLGGTAATAAFSALPAVQGRAQAAQEKPARINDDRHQWGYIGDVIVGDPRIHGRVHLATNGRGVQYGEPV